MVTYAWEVLRVFQGYAYSFEGGRTVVEFRSFLHQLLMCGVPVTGAADLASPRRLFISMSRCVALPGARRPHVRHQCVGGTRGAAGRADMRGIAGDCMNGRCLGWMAVPGEDRPQQAQPVRRRDGRHQALQGGGVRGGRRCSQGEARWQVEGQGQGEGEGLQQLFRGFESVV